MRPHSKWNIYFVLLFLTIKLQAQEAILKGRITDEKGSSLPFVNLVLKDKNVGCTSDTEGVFEFPKMTVGRYTLMVSAVGYQNFQQDFTVKNDDKTLIINIKLVPSDEQLNEVVITGTMKEVRRSESPAPIEVYNAKFFLKNPSPNLFESLTSVNGVRPQLQCSVCNTGDIHINGMEGPYTMVMIDGMPIVSGLSTVYGLLGIPSSMIDRLEVVKGPASTLYGSEAVGGLINVITKMPQKAPILSFDVSATSYSEFNNDFSAKAQVGKATTLFSGNFFHFNKRWDINKDNFTDVTLAKRASIFNKWSFERPNNLRSDVAVRYVWEDRFGGELGWDKTFRGGDSIYGENIGTQRWEVIGTHEFSTSQPLRLQYSFNSHEQLSTYGTTVFNAQQRIAFAQLTAPKTIGKNDFLFGAAMRYSFYDDNTAATSEVIPPSPKESSRTVSRPSKVFLPGVFIQNEIKWSAKSRFLVGIRYDYNSEHGSIITPRLNYKWTPNSNNVLRISYGNGFRVANIFSEDHAALTGARGVEVRENLRPERSHNVNINYVTKFFPQFGFIGIDASAFLTYFNNKILADYDTDPNKIIYDNLDGYGISRGITLNSDFNFKNGLKMVIGSTLMDVFTIEKARKTQQIQTPHFTANWSMSYAIAQNWAFDLTGVTTSPMRLPILKNDYRDASSPWFSIVNFQVKKTFQKRFEVYGGVKNILNFLPKNPLMRPFDPFDKYVNVDNPNNYTFDTSYNYAPMQGIRGFLGVRYQL